MSSLVEVIKKKCATALWSTGVRLARDGQVRQALYGPLEAGTKDEKIGLAGVLARSGDRESIPHLQKLSNDRDADVAQEGLRALRTLQARF